MKTKVIIREKTFSFGRLERWNIYKNIEMFQPKGRKRLFKKWYWRKTMKNLNPKEEVNLKTNSTEIREHKLNRRFLNWCVNTNTHPEDKNAFQGFIKWFCTFYNYNGGVEMITGFKNRRYFVFKKIYII